MSILDRLIGPQPSDGTPASNRPHAFEPATACDLCLKGRDDPIHVRTPLVIDREEQLRRKAEAENHEAWWAEQKVAGAFSDLVRGGYVHDGKIELILHPACDQDALEKVHRFVGNLIAQR